MFLEISQNSQENTCARVSFLIKLQPSGLRIYLKRDSGTGVFLWICAVYKSTSGGYYCKIWFYVKINS